MATTITPLDAVAAYLAATRERAHLVRRGHTIYREREHERKGAILKKWLKTPEAYALLDKTGAKGSTWLAGGCALLALATGKPVYGVRSAHGLEHVVAKVGPDAYLDADGVSTAASLLARMRKLELLENPTLGPTSVQEMRRRGIPCSPKDVALVRSMLP